MNLSSFKLGTLVLAWTIFFNAYAGAANPNSSAAIQNACSNINSTSDYMNCLKLVNPAAAKVIASAPGGAEGFFQQLSKNSGLPSSTWMNPNTPPTLDQIANAASGGDSSFRSRFMAIIHNAEQKIFAKTGSRPQNIQGNLKNDSPVSADAPTLGNRIASIFGSAPGASEKAAEIDRSKQISVVTSMRDSNSIAEDPGVSLFKRIEMKYQEIGPRLLPSSSSQQSLKDWGK